MKKTIFVVLLSWIQSLSAQVSEAELSRYGVQDSLAAATQRAGHGMIVFGNQHIYMYHLPMWDNPHAWHIVLEMELDSNALALYRADQAAGSSLQSFSPKAFALANLKVGYTLSGVLYHGHFEQGGKALPKSSAPAQVTATVKRILTVKALDPLTISRSQAIYRIFGADGEWFAARLPAGRPDFDQVLSLLPTETCTIPEDAFNGLTISLDAVNNTLKGRPKPGMSLFATTSQANTFCFAIKAEPYFSTSDLGA